MTMIATVVIYAILMAVMNLFPATFVFVIINYNSNDYTSFTEVYFGLIACYAILAMLVVS